MNPLEIILVSVFAAFAAWWFGFGWESIPLCFILGFAAAMIVTGVRLITDEDDPEVEE